MNWPGKFKTAIASLTQWVIRRLVCPIAASEGEQCKCRRCRRARRARACAGFTAGEIVAMTIDGRFVRFTDTPDPVPCGVITVGDGEVTIQIGGQS